MGWFRSGVKSPCFKSPIIFFVVCDVSLRFFYDVTMCPMIIEVSSEQWRSQFNMNTECWALLVLLFVIVCRMTAKLVLAGSWDMIPVLSFFSFKRDCDLCLITYPLAYVCVAFTAANCLRP